jgi:hypothetical protein
LDEVDKFIRVFADKVLLVAAANVVPHHSVAVEVVENGDA